MTESIAAVLKTVNCKEPSVQGFIESRFCMHIKKYNEHQD